MIYYLNEMKSKTNNKLFYYLKKFDVINRL